MEKSRSTPPVIRLSTWIYALILHLGPGEFRREFAEPALQTFRQCCRDAYQKRGVWGVLSLWLPLFTEASAGMLAEHITQWRHPSEGRGHVKTIRGSMVAIFCAFLVFGLAWLFFYRLPDPVAPWNNIIRLHPEVVTANRVLRIAGELAFLALIVGGAPIVYATLKYAFAHKYRDVQILFSIATLLVLACIVAMVALLAGFWNGGPNGSVLAILGLLTLVALIAAVARALWRSQVNTQFVRFALLAAAAVTLGMFITLLASLALTFMLNALAPTVYGGLQLLTWTAPMFLATLVALIALWYALRAQENVKATA